MKVLHLPSNMASQMRVTVHVLREMGIEARGLTGPSSVQNSAGLEILPRAEHGGFFQRKLCGLRRAATVMNAISSADVIHWHGETALPMAADLRMAAALGRTCFVEFWGSDIRDPEIEFSDNPHFTRAWKSDDYECKPAESRAHSHRVQNRFAAAGAQLLNVSPGMAQYLVPGLFTRRHETAQRVLLEEYPVSIPSAYNSRPLVVHAPSAPGAKGTRFILAALEKLRAECDFDFKLIHGMTPLEAREWMSRCDLFVDQLIYGEYGVAAVEAMALGKPVVCYIKPSLRPHYPAEFPVINADPETIEEVLREWISDGPRRRAVGEASRARAEERHDARKIVARIAEYYQAA
jgi:glycosyltransferase involved in cell wall biosynthesis